MTINYSPENEVPLTLNGVEYAFVITPKKVIAVRRKDDQQITDTEVLMASDYVRAEGWAEGNPAALKRKRKRSTSIETQSPNVKLPMSGFPPLPMPPPLTRCPKPSRKTRTALSLVPITSLFRLLDLRRLFSRGSI